jgi:hypothetical protein
MTQTNKQTEGGREGIKLIGPVAHFTDQGVVPVLDAPPLVLRSHKTGLKIITKHGFRDQLSSQPMPCNYLFFSHVH